MAVLMSPGLNGMDAMPGGISCASDRESPSMAHLVAQYGATSALVERPQPELKLTMIPRRAAIMAGTKWRITFATPLMLISTTSENSWAPTFHKGALRLMMAALFSSKSGGPKAFKRRLAQDFTSESAATFTL